MTPKQCRTQIQNLLDTLLITELAVDRLDHVISSAPGGFNRVTWAHLGQHRGGELFCDDFYTIETYMAWVESRHYSAVLFDGSLLQLTFEFRGPALVGHRLAYLPCPFLIGDEGTELLRFEPIFDVIDMYRARGDRCLRLRSPLRFDFDPGAAAAEHPASHLTLNAQECRIPACGPLYLGQFIDFVFRHFYPGVLGASGVLVEAYTQMLPRQITEAHEQSIHLNWRSDRRVALDPLDDY